MNEDYYLDHIIKYINENLNIDIKVRTRKTDYIYARSLYFKIAREHTAISFNKIGRKVNLNHATVMHGINKVFPVVLKYEPKIKNIYDSFVFENILDIGRLIYLTKELNELENKILEDYCLVLN
jgi:chromosomal replication initiation ATPase DnaA